ncbi:MAG: hypothetical protein ACYS47_06490 [Planctomycetota bacterium]|jgi:hypothetical protein
MMLNQTTKRILVQGLGSILILVAGAAKGAATFEGTLDVKRDDSGKAESATLRTALGKLKVDLLIVLDKAGLKMAEEAAGRTIQVSGSISTKKKERWLKVKSFALVLTGTAEVTQDEKRKLKSIVFTAEGWPSPFNVLLDGKAKPLAKRAEDKTFLVIGTLVKEKEGTTVLKVQKVSEIEMVKGVVEVKEDRKGKKTGAFLAVEGEKGKVQYLIFLDAVGCEIMETLGDATVEVVGIVTGKGRKRSLRVIRYRKV